MSVNYRRGFTRLAFAICITYFAFWAYVGWLGYSSMPKYLELSHQASARGDWQTSTIWMKAANDANAQMNSSLAWGVAIPLASLVAGIIAYWVFRGFMSKAPSSN